MLTIGQVSKLFNLPISTLRYYDKQGLFPNIKRISGIRKFSDSEIESLRVIECLKKSGMEIKDIKIFMEWCQEGPTTYQKRKDMFERQQKIIEREIHELEKNLAMIKFKCWYYNQAIKDGHEDNIAKMLPDSLPPKIQELYNISRNDKD